MKKNSIRRYANKEEIDQAFEVARELLMSLRSPPLLIFHEVALKLTGMRHKSIAELVQDFNNWNKRIQEQFDLWSDVVSVLAWNELFAHSELDSDAQSFSHRLRVTVCLVHNWIENLESVLRSIGGKDISELQLCELNRESTEKLREALRRYPLRLGNTSKFNELDKPLEKMHSRLLRDLHLLPVSKGIDEAGKQAGKGAENGDGLPTAATPDRETLLATMPNAWRQAYLANQYAEEKAGKELTATAAYAWLREHGFDGYELPLPDTFSDYRTKAFNHLGEQRKRRRIVDPSRSVVRRSALDTTGDADD